ncbi:MAG TPA: phosphate acyltransferase [Isosphaeraceae bacterium]|nr:phosphate acyltransferase [Isosphaeraceae bacterium]
MPLDGFDRLAQLADAQAQAASVSVAGGDDPTVLEALRAATDRGWVRPILVGPAPRIESLAAALALSLDGFTIHHAQGDAVADAAVAAVRAGRARMLMKGQISTPALMAAVLSPTTGLRSDQKRVVCQVVLMEIPRDDRRFLLADTGICIHPDRRKRLEILRQAVDVAHALGASRPKVALLAATETVKVEMPETLEAAELSRRNRAGEFDDCVIEGPLSFDLAYAVEAGARKRVEGSVVGAAEILLFPNLLSANLTVKAIMYTAECRFGGILSGTSAPVVFMSRADTAATRLHSLALALRILDHGQT